MLIRYCSKEKLIKNMAEFKKEGWYQGKILREVGIFDKGVESFSCTLYRDKG